MRKHTVLITGGHPTPALAVIDEATSCRAPVRFVFVGRRHVNTRETAQSLEYQEIFSRKIPFVESGAKRGWRGGLTLPLEVLRAVSIIRARRPHAVLSFGGYVSVPVCIAAFVMGIPVYLHEQTIRPGRANRMLANIARRIMISFDQSASYFPSSKVVRTGNPIRPLLTHARTPTNFESLKHPIVLVLGGNLGSHSLNTHIFNILDDLLDRYSVIHQIGNVAEYDDWDRALRLHLDLPDTKRSRYIPMQHLSTGDMSEVFHRADCIVSRSGASTVIELIALRKPAVLVPLPWSAYAEQQLQADLLKDAGVSLTFHQSGPSSQLLESIQRVADNVQSYASHYDTLSSIYEPQAAAKILDIVLQSSRTS